MKSKHAAKLPWVLVLAAWPALAPGLARADEPDRKLDEISVTATREARATAQLSRATLRRTAAFYPPPDIYRH